MKRWHVGGPASVGGLCEDLRGENAENGSCWGSGDGGWISVRLKVEKSLQVRAEASEAKQSLR